MKKDYSNISDYLRYCSTAYSIEDSKNFTLDFLNSRSDMSEFLDINKIDFCWFLNLGFIVKYYMEYEQTENLYNEIIKRLNSLKKRINQKTQTVKLKPIVKKPLDDILNSIDLCIDRYLLNKEEHFVRIDVTNKELNIVRSYLQKQISDIDNEQYPNYTKLKNFLEDMIHHIEKHHTKKKEIKNKKNNSISNRKKDLNIKKKVIVSVPFHVESVYTPLTIIGKKILIIFDVKTRTLYLFKSLEKNGFYFSGKSLRGFDNDLSYGKKIKKHLDVTNMNLEIFDKILVNKSKAKSLFSDNTRILYLE